ncbi:peptidoglycan DD-metalloendopeptidase family protein [Burkholderia sp. FERM BP-3421]|uniref:peptidoglycan DD-metalloendopeptidase family protein n=1 Tax=Burkholderia sp. FERM BP-3421 TaxID=1494466 RepID=UPI0023602295|nr:peptidoglycan DD-metalloendopeptidase family protein [Burkholderia sp. FERM BP-3421]WDD93169.1 peptidoglycan DD-metalloendopeptidase family protein [Burkholderia sp. FERM BP-3421]
MITRRAHRASRYLVIPLLAVCLQGGAAMAADADVALQQAARQAFSTRLGKQAPTLATAGQDALVETIRVTPDGDWVLGAATQIVPDGVAADPVSKLFVARRAQGAWRVGVEGDATYAALLGAAPAALVGPAERAQLDPRRGAAGGQPKAAPGQTGLALPWQRDTAWYWTGGAHGWSGESRPYNSLDFSGGDGRVLAARDAYLYRSCERNGSAIVKLVHDNGYETTYYHMEQLAQVANGARIRQGDYLGRIGNALPCGGQTTGAHVHLSLSQGGTEVPVNGKTIGGWQFFEGPSAYGGYAVRNQRRVGVQAALTNYGSDDSGGPPEPGRTVDAPIRAPGNVNLRDAPSLSASVVGSVANGATVTLACFAYGDTVQGNWGATRLWYRLNSNQWVSDGYVYTGSNDPVVPACAN